MLIKKMEVVFDSLNKPMLRWQGTSIYFGQLSKKWKLVHRDLKSQVMLCEKFNTLEEAILNAFGGE